MTHRYILSLVLMTASISMVAQEIGYGFKAGLSFNSFNGDSEKDDAGNSLESFSGNTGFHVGATFTWKATELMGVRGELMYSQKGGRRKFEGPSYLTLHPTAGNDLPSTGTRKMELNISSSTIEIPVMGYFKPVPWAELYAGGYAAFNISTTVFGDFAYTGGETPSGTAVADIRFEIDGNYASDNPGEASFTDPPTLIKAGASDIIIPRSASPYYEFTEDRGNLYKVLDLGLIGGLSLYLNRGLYVTGRVNYGMTDITRTRPDVSLSKLDNGNFITRNDDDRNFSIQTSIGFSF